MANIKASTLKNRKADTENAMDKVNARILSGNMVAELEFVMKAGFKVRVPNAEMPVSREDVVDVLNANRAVTKEDLLENLGENVMNFLVKKGFIRQASATIFYVTKAAAKNYKLRKPQVGNYF